MKGPVRKPQGRVEKTAGFVASLLFIVFVVWLVNGVVQGGWLRWFAVALFVAPIVGLMAFYAWLFIALILQGKRNLREAARARRDAGSREES